MTISISASLLTSYYNAKEGIGAAVSSTTSSATAKAAPTPPWQSTSTAPQQSALVTSVLNGSAFFNSSATALTNTNTGSVSASDYKNLFTLYQGITALQGLAADASATGVTATQLASYQAAFTKGMAQLQTYLGQTSFSALDVTQGTLTASDQTTEGATVETDTYTTGTIYSGSSSDVVPAFSGAAAFSMTLTDTHGVGTTVNFDLSQMGSTPRTMANVTNYLNSQLAAAGVKTRFKLVSTAGTPDTTTVNGQTVTLNSNTPTNYSLEVVGTTTEAVTFNAPTTSPAVYVTASSGTAAAAATSLTAAVTGDQTQQLLKFDAGTDDPTTSAVSDNTLASTVSSALASATGPDGSVYVVANVDGTTDGQSINGTQDVALMKYDSAGNLVYTRTLGAADSATGYSIAVSPDGTNVAVAGSVTGSLDGDDPGESSTSTNSFVTEYNASTGDENWTNTQASSAGDSATGVAFGSDGSVYVTGTTQAKLPGAAAEIGGQDGYLRSYSSTGAITSTTQFGMTGTDTPSGVVVSGSSVYVAGTENGDAVVRQFNIGSGGAATAGAVRDLGSLQGGTVAGIGVTSDGSIVVGGSTKSGALSAGTVTTAYQSGQEGFVASLSPTLAASSSDTLSYLPTSGNLDVTAMTVSGDQVYLAGALSTTPQAGSGYTNTTNGYLAAVNPDTGAVTWSQQFQGTDGKASPTSISVASTGSSVLDAFGLPSSIDYAQSTLLVDNTSLRAGDSFYVQSGSGTPQQITISATDTLQTLQTEIERASGYTATVTTPTVSGETELKIVAANSTQPVKLISGPTGSDALAGLGLVAGEINNDVGQTSTSSHTAKVTLGLNLSSTLNLNSTASIKAATTALNLASAKIQNAYQSLINPTGTTTSSTSTSTPSAYVTAQIANYQSALSWLENNEGTSTSSTSTLLL